MSSSRLGLLRLDWAHWDALASQLLHSLKPCIPVACAPNYLPLEFTNCTPGLACDKSLCLPFQVRVLPYPFTHHQQFERTIQTPIGSTWNTQRAFQKLTMPKVVTKPGHIIKPIKAEDVGYRSSSRSDLSVVQRNPKQLTVRHKKQLKKNSID